MGSYLEMRKLARLATIVAHLQIAVDREWAAEVQWPLDASLKSGEGRVSHRVFRLTSLDTTSGANWHWSLRICLGHHSPEARYKPLVSVPLLDSLDPQSPV